MSRSTCLASALGPLLASWLLLAHVAVAGEPPTDPLLRIEAGMHTAQVAQVATDAANRYLVTASHDKTARVWDLESGALLRVLRPPVGAGSEGQLRGVAISPDGRTVACGGWTGSEWDRVDAIYLFDRATGRLTRRISGLPNVVQHLAWSPHGGLLAVALGGPSGIRVFRPQDGTAVGADTAYGGPSYSVEFDRSSGRLVSTAFDGAMRLYSVSDRALTLLRKQPAPGGKRPFSAHFSPDGGRIAVGYEDSQRVDVLAGDTLGHLYSANTQGVTSGDMGAVAWSADGRQLYAGGRHSAGATFPIRVWAEAGRGAFVDLPAAANTVQDIISLRTGGIAYAAGGPMFGVFDAGGRKRLEQRASIAEFRDNRGGFRLSPDGTAVEFAFEQSGKSPARFELRDRRLVTDPPASAALAAPVTAAPGLDIQDWPGTSPKVNGRPLVLSSLESSTSVAIAPDQASFVLGAWWSLRRFDRQGTPLWNVTIPGFARAVNVSGDGKLVAAALGDGTIRWYRLRDGAEVLALFPHADRKRWVLWSPSGYYDASAGAEDLIGWHVNRGKDAEADFFPASRFRATFYRPDVVAKALEAADETTALRLANEDAGRKTLRVDVARTLPPVVQILSPGDGTAVSTADVRVRFTVRTAADAPLLGIRARVNGQPVSLGEARTVAVVPAAGTEREVVVAIAPGDSEIMLFAENRHGVSVPAVLRLAWRPVAAAPAGDFVVKPKLYVLAVGVSDYRNRDLKLQFAAKDARDFARVMLAQKGGLYRDVEVKILADADATRDEVADGLDWLKREVTARDVGMMFLAGHGVTDSHGVYYYLPVNADVTRLTRTGVPFSDIKNTLGALAGGKAVFFVDTCHSGSVMGARRGAPDINAVVNELASAENGVVVFASSTGKQYALESADWNNGAFTKALVEGLSGKADFRHTGRITHKMLDFYVAERVKELTQGRQTPVNPSPAGVPDFPIATPLRP